MYRVINFGKSETKCNYLCPVKGGKVTFTDSQTFLAFLTTNGSASIFVTVRIIVAFVYLSCCSEVPIWKLNSIHFECTTIIILYSKCMQSLRGLNFSKSNETHWFFVLCFCMDRVPFAWRLKFIIRYFLFTEWNYIAVTNGLDVLICNHRITSVPFFDKTERKIFLNALLFAINLCTEAKSTR